MKFIQYLLILIFSSIFFQSVSAKDIRNCSSLMGHCDFYHCAEKAYQCGLKGYLEKFGYKYCLEFIEKENNFSSEGQRFLEKTRKCLTEKIYDYPSVVSCKHLEKRAYKVDHVECYIENGYCDLERNDQKQISKIVRGDMWRPRIIFSGAKVKRICDDPEYMNRVLTGEWGHEKRQKLIDKYTRTDNFDDIFDY